MRFPSQWIVKLHLTVHQLGNVSYACNAATLLPGCHIPHITPAPPMIPAYIYKSHTNTSSFLFLIMPLRYFISGPFLVLILGFIIYSILAHHLLRIDELLKASG